MHHRFANSLGIRLRRAYQALHRRANDELRRGFGVTANQFVVLSLLAERDGVSQQELSDRCYSDPSTTGALVRLMERRGWVERHADPQDSRVRQVHLTESGRKLQEKLWVAAAESFHRDLWSVPGTQEEEQQLFRFLDRVVEVMERPAGSGSEAVAPYRLSAIRQEDPYSYYRQLRDHDPAHWSPVAEIWVLTRYQDVSNAFRDWSTWSSARRGNLVNDMPERIGSTMGTMDPPDHRRARNLVEQAFSRRVIDRLGPRIAERAKRLAEQVREAGSADLVAEVSAPFNASILGAMFGVPASDFMRLRRWLDDFFLREAPRPGRPSRQRVAMGKLREYLDALATKRLTAPSDDLISKLLAAEDGGLSLSRKQVVITTMTFLTAGFESTNNLFTNVARALALHPDVYNRVKANPGLTANLVEEGMRWDSPAQGFVRSPTRDVSLHGRTIPKGAQVLLHIGSANRDERQFEQPDRFDLDRKQNRHLSLGMGIHFCIGAALAREMAGSLFRALLDASEKWEIDSERAVRVTTPNFRGFSVLPLSI